MPNGFKNVLVQMRREKLVQKTKKASIKLAYKKLADNYSHSMVAGGFPEIS